MRATDEDGRGGGATTTSDVHRESIPDIFLRWTPEDPAVGEPVKVIAIGYGSDAAVTRVEVDGDGDGVYEVDSAIPAGTQARADSNVTFDSAGRRTVRARVTEADGSVAVETATITAGASEPGPGSAAIAFLDPPGRPGVRVLPPANQGLPATYEFDMDGEGQFDDHLIPTGEQRGFMWTFDDATGGCSACV